MQVVWKYCAILYERLEHLWILVSPRAGGPGTSHPMDAEGQLCVVGLSKLAINIVWSQPRVSV